MQLREFVWVLRSSSVLSIDATDRSQISNDRYRYQPIPLFIFHGHSL